jgi:hypothetical protein
VLESPLAIGGEAAFTDALFCKQALFPALLVGNYAGDEDTPAGHWATDGRERRRAAKALLDYCPEFSAEGRRDRAKAENPARVWADSMLRAWMDMDGRYPSGSRVLQ